MLLDQQALFSAAQAITATAASTNVIDTGSSKDVGKYGDIPLLIQVVEAFNTLTSLTVTVQTDDNSSFSSATDVISMVIPLASLTVGYKTPVITLPMKLERYIRLNYTVTAGKARLDPTESHYDNLAAVNSSTGGCGSWDSFWLCEPALRMTLRYIVSALLPRSALPVSGILMAAARRQDSASMKIASNMFTSVTRAMYFSHA
jgi:hypothetical protein